MNPDFSAPLTHEEFVSLRDCAKGLMHRTIPAEHKDRLIQLVPRHRGFDSLSWADSASGFGIGAAHFGAGFFGCEHPFDAGAFGVALLSQAAISATRRG